MSINPTLAHSSTSKTLVPYGKPGEFFILERPTVKFTGSYGRSQFVQGTGSIVITSLRLVAILSQEHKSIKSIELPHHLTRGVSEATPKFEQPIFGANRLVGVCDQDSSAPQPFRQQINWAIEFIKGGCDIFLKAYLKTHREARKIAAAGAPASAPNIFSAIPQSFSNVVAYGDSQDPTTFFVSQPVFNPIAQPQSAPMYMPQASNQSYGQPQSSLYPQNTPGYIASTPAYNLASSMGGAGPVPSYGAPVAAQVQYGAPVASPGGLSYEGQQPNVFPTSATPGSQPQPSVYPVVHQPQFTASHQQPIRPVYQPTQFSMGTYHNAHPSGNAAAPVQQPQYNPAGYAPPTGYQPVQTEFPGSGQPSHYPHQYGTPYNPQMYPEYNPTNAQNQTYTSRP